MRVRDARLRGRSRSVAAKAREKRLRDNSVENSVKHFQFHANWRKLFGELGQILITETVLVLNQNSRQTGSERLPPSQKLYSFCDSIE